MQQACSVYRDLDECGTKIPPLQNRFGLHNPDASTLYHCNCTSRYDNTPPSSLLLKWARSGVTQRCDSVSWTLSYFAVCTSALFGFDPPPHTHTPSLSNVFVCRARLFQMLANQRPLTEVHAALLGRVSPSCFLLRNCTAGKM